MDTFLVSLLIYQPRLMAEERGLKIDEEGFEIAKKESYGAPREEVKTK